MKTASRFPDHLPVDIVAGRNREVNAASERSVMRMLRIAGLICMLLSMVHQNVQAQTEWKDNYVTLAANDQTNPAIARPSNTEYTMIVWEDMRDGGKDIYAQKIDNTNGLPQWTPVDGVPVCTSTGSQANPRAAYDSLGHVIIVWEDYRSYQDSAAIYAQCLDVSDGSVAANWPSNGFAICDTAANALQPRIVGGSDGAFIAWVDWRHCHSNDPDTLNRHIYLQYIYSSYPGWPQGGSFSWTSGGIHVSCDPLAHDEAAVELARDSWWFSAADSKDKDGVVLVYESKRRVSTTTADSIYVVYANSYDANGNERWNNQDIRCATSDEQQLNPRVVVLGTYHGVGDSVAVIVWQDEREDPNNARFDIYGQVLSKKFSTVLGTATGNAICTATYTQRYPEISLYEREEDIPHSISYLARVICVWEDLRDIGTTGVDVYCAVMNGITEAIMTAAGTDGEVVCIAADDQRYPKVDNFPEETEAYIVWVHEPSSGYSDIWYNAIDQCLLQWTWTQGIGLEVTGAKYDQTSPQVGGDVFVYADYRRQPITYDNTYDWNIYAETPGECVGEKYMDWRDMFAEVTTTGDAAHMRFVLDDEFNTFVVWEEPGSGHGEQNVFIQKLDVDGVPRWENSGIKLNTTTYASHPEVTISDSTGGAQVVWHQNDGRADSVWYAKLSPMGAFTHRDAVGAGKAPVIDYTDLAFPSGGGGSYTPTYRAYIGSLNASRTADLWEWNNGSASWDPSLIPSGFFDSTPEGIVLKASLGGGLYGAVYSSVSSPNYVTPFAGNRYDNLVTGGSAPHTGGSLQGLDIERDDFGTAASMKIGCLVYCLSPGVSTYTDLVSVWLDPSTLTVGDPWTIFTAAQDEYYRYPALCADHSLNGAWGGMLLAWDHDMVSGGSHAHDVYTNQLMGDGSDWLPAPVDPIQVNPTSTSYALYPDIARIDQATARGDTTAFVVWEDILEQCSPSRAKEVVGNWVIYDTTSGARGVGWYYPKMIGPGAGSYSQTRPMVRTSKDSTVNVFWYDSRGSSVLVMGTRVWAADTAIDWAKDVVEETPIPEATIHLGENYPNPLSLSRTRVSHIMLDMSAEASVNLTLYDNLGRKVGVVYDGLLPAGLHDLRFDVSTIPAGMYHYVLRTDRLTASRGLILVR